VPDRNPNDSQYSASWRSSEPVRCEASSNKSQQWLRSVVQNASDIITILEEDATVRYVSPAVKTILGYEPEELVGRKAMDFVHPDDLERTVEEFAQALSQQGTRGAGVENRLRHKNGSWRYLYGLATNLLDDPAVRGLVINSRDVTERVLADKVLRESEERFRLLAENAQDLIFRLRLKPTLGFEYVSPSATAMLGYTPEEHYADPELGLKTVLPEDRHLLEAAIRTPEAPLTLRWRRKDGQVIWTEQRSRPIYDEAGELVAVEGIVRDITDRKRVEEEKARLADHLRLLLESTDEGIYGIDRRGRCTFVNQSAARMLGYHPDELLGERMHQLIHHTRNDGSPYPEEECSIYRTFEENRGVRVDSEVFWRRDETPVPVEYSSYPIVKNGDVEGAIVAFVDITERRHAEEKLRESEERFKAQYKGFPLPTYSWRKVGEDFLLIDHNHAAYEFTQGRIVDFIGGKASQQYGNAPELLGMLNRAFEERTTVRREMPWTLLTTGEDKHLVISSTFVPPDLVVMHTEDVTERVRSEEKLKENEERFRLLAENAKDMIYRYRLKPAPAFEYVSPSVTAITGYTPEEHYADPQLGLKIVHPDDRYLLEAFLGSPEYSDRALTLRWIDKDGKIVWTEQRINMFHDARGDLVAIEGIGRDITERKVAEDALKRSEERFRSLVQNASDVIIILDAGGTIRYVSPAIERVLGFVTEKVVGKNAAAFVAPVDRMKAIRLFARAKREPGIGERTEFQLQHKDGTWRHLEIDRNNLLHDPSVGGIVINVRDVTDRKLAEGQLRRRAFHDLLGGLQSRYSLVDITQEQSSTQHRLIAEVPHCEFAENLRGEDCELPGTTWSEGKLLCEDHARQYELQDRMDLLRGIISSLELCLDNVAVRRDANFVRLLKAEVAHATRELELAREELRRAKR
jgi:PAS domain S-box-containing protein